MEGEMPPAEPPKRPPPPLDSAALWRLSGMGFVLLSEVLAGVVLGWLLDWWLGTSPIFLIIGALLGVTIALTNFIRQAMKVGRRSARRDRK